MKVLKMKPSDDGLWKALKNDIKEAMAEQTVASIFWKVMVYIIFFVVFLYSHEAAKWLSAFASFLFVGIMLDGGFEDENIDWFWVPLAIMFWIILLILLVGVTLYFLISRFYRYIIKPFNNFLNSLSKY